MKEINDLEKVLKILPLEEPYFVFITGASGVGKTTLIKALEKNLLHLPISFNFFDDIGVPTGEEMIAKFGSGEKWQQAMVEKWIQKLSAVKVKKIVILEGSANPEFIKEALEKLNEERYILICFEAERKIRENRLISFRNQPELANADMENWAEFLKVKTLELNGQIVETNAQDIKVSTKNLLRLILSKIKEANFQNAQKGNFPNL